MCFHVQYNINMLHVVYLSSILPSTSILCFWRQLKLIGKIQQFMVVEFLPKSVFLFSSGQLKGSLCICDNCMLLNGAIAYINGLINWAEGFFLLALQASVFADFFCILVNYRMSLVGGGAYVTRIFEIYSKKLAQRVLSDIL